MAGTKDRSGQATYNVTATLDPTQLKSLKRAIQDVGKDARRSMRNRLKEVGVVVQTEIRRRTPVGKRYATGSRKRALASKRGVTRTAAHTAGLLKRSTKLNVGSLSVAIYNDAKAVSKRYPNGYRYGKRLEFDTHRTRREFFYPGYEAKKAQATQMFDKVLDDAVKTYMKS